MADLKQGVRYEITAEDMTKPAHDSVQANFGKTQKAASDAANQAKKEANDAKGLFASVTQAISGNFGELASKVAEATSGMKGLKVSGLALGAIGAIVSSVVSIVKDLWSHWKAVREQTEKIRFDNMVAEVERLKTESEAVAAAIELQKKRAESMRDVLTAQVDATKKLRDAQIEYAKAQELSLAKTDEERKLIEEKYKAQSKVSDREYSASRREIQMKTAQDEIANLEKRLEAARDREKNATRLANDYMRQARGLAESDGFFDMKHRGESGQRIQSQIETLGGKSRESMGEAQSAIREQQDLELQIQTARKKLGSLKRAQEAEVLSESASGINDETASRLQGEEETRKIREETQKIREETERARKEMADLAKKDAEEVARARAKAEADSIRQRELAEKTAHERRMREISSEKAALTDSASAANARLSAARSAVQQAWGWYRDKGSMAAQLEDEKANAEAEAQFEKDFARLRRRGNWETAKNLSVDQEAVRRVALARQEEDAAQKAVAAINLKMDKVVAELEKITEGET